MIVPAARWVLGFCAAALLLSGCGRAALSSTANLPLAAQSKARRPSGSTTPIQHVVLMIQENRSFNDFFATFPGADGTTMGQALGNASCRPPIAAGPIALKEMPLALSEDLNHSFKTGYSVAYDNGNMDGFDDAPFGKTGQDECSYPYQYTNPSEIAPYLTMATEYALAEHMFTTQGSDSFTAHQDLIRGGTIVGKNEAMVDLPGCSGTKCYWGCNAPSGTKTRLINSQNEYLHRLGPYPCSKNFRYKNDYETLRDLLDAKGVSWKYYVPPSDTVNGKLLSAFRVIWPVYDGPEWETNISSPETNIFNDVSSGQLPAMSWVIPDVNNSDHPGSKEDYGPQWVASVVNAIGESSYWDSTAIIIVWDDWGGFYDNKAATMAQYGGPGERVPAIIVSPYAKAGYISTTTYQFGSILHYIENNWNLGSLGTTDNATSIVDCFDYSQTPIPFQPIASSLGKSYFTHEKHSHRAPDDDW
jgi:phospholipase C